jgi:hypothetical protein
MKFFEKYGAPTAIRRGSKPMTSKDMLLHGIPNQRKLLLGQTVLNTAKKPIRSWFNDSMFSPKVGIYSLFNEHSIPCTEGEQQQMLSDFETALRAGEFDSYLATVDAKRTKSN